MRRFIKNSAINFFTSNFTASRHVRPVLVTYHLTHRCNLNCFFCEHCGITHNSRWEADGELSTEKARALLKMLSKPFAFLYITGGEPFLRDDVCEIFAEIDRLPFKNVSVNTNLTLINRIEKCLPAINDLIVSIDSVEPQRFDEIRGVKGIGKVVLANFERALAWRRDKKIKLNVNCVVTPSTIEDARKVVRFCISKGIKVAVNAQNDKHGPVKALLGNKEFKKFVVELIELKKRTGLILGTKMYYERMFEFQPYNCYPFLTPRINAKGALAYPCDNLDQWVPDIIECGSWDEVMKKVFQKYGRVPDCKKACQFQCYIEPSKMVRRPWLALKEYL